MSHACNAVSDVASIERQQISTALFAATADALTSAMSFCERFSGATVSARRDPRPHLLSAHEEELLAISDERSEAVTDRMLIGSEARAVVVLAVQEVVEYASAWYQMERLGAAVVGLPILDSPLGWQHDLDPFDFAALKAADLERDIAESQINRIARLSRPALMLAR